ncbi:hypothetical protein DFO46_0027 [Rhizobium sp. AG855]|nr:hypothetical protein DFO46_0027 [Rhizobium sp. AG855]
MPRSLRSIRLDGSGAVDPSFLLGNVCAFRFLFLSGAMSEFEN